MMICEKMWPIVRGILGLLGFMVFFGCLMFLLTDDSHHAEAAAALVSGSDLK